MIYKGRNATRQQIIEILDATHPLGEAYSSHNLHIFTNEAYPPDFVRKFGEVVFFDLNWRLVWRHPGSNYNAGQELLELGDKRAEQQEERERQKRRELEKRTRTTTSKKLQRPRDLMGEKSKLGLSAEGASPRMRDLVRAEMRGRARSFRNSLEGCGREFRGTDSLIQSIDSWIDRNFVG